MLDGGEMSAYVIMDRWADCQGWSLASQLCLALEYIGRQESDDAFDDFLAQIAERENRNVRPTDSDE